MADSHSFSDLTQRDAATAGAVSSRRVGISSALEQRRGQHRNRSVAPLKVAPPQRFVALRVEVRHRVQRCRSILVLLGEPDLVSAQGAFAAVPENRRIVAVEDQLGAPGVGPGFWKSRTNCCTRCGCRPLSRLSAKPGERSGTSVVWAGSSTSICSSSLVRKMASRSRTSSVTPTQRSCWPPAAEGSTLRITHSAFRIRTRAPGAKVVSGGGVVGARSMPRSESMEARRVCDACQEWERKTSAYSSR